MDDGENMHTTSFTRIYTQSCMPAQKPVYIFMFVTFVDISFYSLVEDCF